MLEFFRMYQRYFFLVIAVVVIASFTFFGTFSAMTEGGPVREDRVIAKAVDGSPIKESEVRNLARFLSTDQNDFDLKPGQIPNFCNDGAVRKDLLGTGLADLLAASYFDLLKEGMGEKLDRMKRYRPYAHPGAPDISASSIWERFNPALLASYNKILEGEAATPETFRQLSQLYLQQAVCPPEFVRRILMYQARQNPQLAADPRMQHDDFALFGFHSLSDWFGSDFLDLSAEFILNGARRAEEKGFRVSIEEAKGDLLRNFNGSMQRLAEGKNRPDLTFRQHLRMLGFDVKSAASAWRSVLLFRRYFESVGDAAFVDRLPFRDFGSFTQEAAVVQLYRCPSYLRMKNLQDLVELQLYIRAVSDLKDPLALPTDYLSLEEIKKRCPDLIASTYKAKIASVQKEQVGLRASLKEAIDWTLEEKNWNFLRKQFPFLPLAATREERFASLERLDPASRSQVDAAVRLQLVEENPAWIEEALSALPKEEKTIEVLPNWTSLPAFKRGGDLQAQCLDQSDVVSYTEDGKTFCRFEEVEKVVEEHLLPFQEAKRKGILARLADRFLEGEYPKIRAQHPEAFQTKEGGWKPLSQGVKEEIAYWAFAPLIRALGKEGEPLANCAAHRLEPYAKQALAALQKNPADPRFVKASEDLLQDQFKLEKKQREIQRTAQEEWMKEQAFVMVPKQWSPVHVSPDGEVAFFFFDEMKPQTVPLLEQISLGKQTLAADAKRYLAENLLELIQKKGAIAPLSQGGEE